MPKLERVLVGLDGGDNGRLASRLAAWLIGARHLTATVMEVDGAPKNGGPTLSPSQRVIEAAETAAHAAEAKDNPPKNDARDPIDAAVEGAKAERIPVRELISILPLKAHDDTTDDACADVILAEAKKGYGLLFLGLGAGSKATAHNFPTAIEKIVREFAGPIAILLNCAVGNVPSDAALERVLVPTTAADHSRFGGGSGSGYCQRLRGHDHRLEYFRSASGK